jgi:hypothetical protein
MTKEELLIEKINAIIEEEFPGEFFSRADLIVMFKVFLSHMLSTYDMLTDEKTCKRLQAAIEDYLKKEKEEENDAISQSQQ